MPRFKVPVAVVVMITRVCGGKRQLLLQRRSNTGFGDGKWDFACSGHVEEGERLRETCVRECREELGISSKPEDFAFFTLIYKRDPGATYVNAYFCLTEYAGTPSVCEESKCSALGWFDESALPHDLLDDRRLALDCFLKNEHFAEYFV